MSNLPALGPHHFMLEAIETYLQLNFTSTVLPIPKTTIISSTWPLIFQQQTITRPMS